MPDKFALDDFPCELSVNGVSMRSVQIRRGAERTADFEVVVNDPIVGSFALHSEFEINLKEPGLNWHRVSLHELKTRIRGTKMLPLDYLPNTSEIAECQLFARVDDVGLPDWDPGRLSSFGREEACVRYVQRIFFRTGIPHLVSGATFVVPSAPTARIPLKRAGFRRSTISPSALIEPRTNVTIQLVERDPRR